MLRPSLLLGLIALTSICLLPGKTWADCLYYGGGADTPGEGLDVVVSGFYAYVADGTAGLLVIDISRPGSPEIVGNVNTPGTAQSVELSGSYAYVADSNFGLQVIDISNPLFPAIVGNVDTPGSARGVAVSGSRVYVADGYIGLHVIDVSNPTAPTILGSVDTPGEARDVAVSGSYAYIADLVAGFTVVNVSSAASPAVVANVSPIISLVYGVTVSGSTAYVVGYHGLQAINISNPASPVLGGHDNLRYEYQEVTVYGSYIYVAGYLGYSVYKTSNLSVPVWQESAAFYGNGIAIDGAYVWVASGSSGLKLYVTQDAIVGRVATPDLARDVFVSGGLTYVADFGSGLQIIDTSDPANPTLAGSLDTPGSANGVWVSGNYVYVADGTAGLQIIDISNPASPVLVSSFDTQGGAAGVTVSGSYAYVADGVYCLRVIDISNPASPTEVGFVYFQGSAGSIAVSGSYAYIGAASVYPAPPGLRVVDISDPHSPVVVGIVNTTNSATDLAISGSHLYLTEGGGEGGLDVIDITDPTSPNLVGRVDTPLSPVGVAVSGSIAYVSDSNALAIIDINDPVLPVFVGRLVMVPGATNGVAVSGSNVYVAHGTNALPNLFKGLTIVPTQCTICSVTVDAGGPYMSCGTGCVNLDAHVGGLASSGTWSTSGTGTFSPDPNTINAQYCPSAADLSSGSVTVTLTTDDPEGECNANFDTATMALAESVRVIIVGPTLQCGSGFQIHGVIYGAAGGTWSTSGTGRFVAGTRNLANIYSLSEADWAAGSVTITLTSDDPPGGCDAETASLTVTFCPMPTVDAGGPYQTCGTHCVQLDGTITGGSGPAGRWQTSGSGTFLPNRDTIDAQYCPSAGDFQSGSVVLTLVSYFDSDIRNYADLTLAPCPVTVDAGGPYQTCGALCVPLNGTLTGDDSTTARWLTSGSGTFQPNNTALHAQYWPSAADVQSGSVVLTLTYSLDPSTQDDAALALSPPVSATVDVEPNQLNLGSGGQYVNANVELPNGYDPARIVIETVRLNETVAATSGQLADANHNHVPDLALKFPREAVQAVLPEGDSVPVTITGNIDAICTFLGTDYVRVVRPRLNHPNGGESFPAGTSVTVDWDNPAGWTVDHAQIHYSADGGTTWSMVADQVHGESYVWTAPSTPTDNALLRVVLLDDLGVMGYDSSDQPFVIRATTGIDQPPQSFRLYPNAPNPFEGVTRITFDLPVDHRVALGVYDLRGRRVRALADDAFPAGRHTVSWDARDTAGHPVVGGIYFLRIEAGAFNDTKRMYLHR